MTRLLWTDIETTGLSPHHDVILEVAIVVTDKNLNELAHKSMVVAPEVFIDKRVLSPAVVEMHTLNNLWDECERSHTTADAVENGMLQFIQQHVEPKEAPMCGSTISFDRSFLKLLMPKLESFFHYRNVDVTTLNELAQRWNMPAWIGRPKADKSHRALADIRHSIETLKHYRNTFLTVLDLPA